MNKKSQFILIVLILVFGAGIASANTLFLKQEWKTLENWDKNKTTNNIINAEGYREPEDMKSSEGKVFNTFFSKAESKTLENWNQEKTIENIGKAEGYRDPETIKPSEDKSFNTLFSKAESNILENWNQEKTLHFKGQEIVCTVNCVPGIQ